MLQLFKCVLCLLVMLVVFTVWGHGIGKRIGLREMHLPLQILCGCFSFFILSQIIIIPMIFLRISLRHTAWILLLALTVVSLCVICRGRRKLWHAIFSQHISIWTCITLFVLAGLVLLSVRQQYMGYDTCYYVGQMNAFLQYDSFWTRDAFAGMAETSVIPLHYALSCFYPLWAIMAYFFHIEARLIAMYSIRSLCVILFACVAYTWGYEFFGKKEKNAYIFTLICLILSMFALSEHSSAFMMMVRGYESKGYCAAVVAPMCAYALIRLFKNIDSKADWRFLGLVAWSSVPIAMSSLAVIPFAVAVCGLAMMIENKRFWDIFRKCLICVLPNLCFLVWYVLGN